MNNILAMREKRGEVWDKAKAFLNEHQDENGMLYFPRGYRQGSQTRATDTSLTRLPRS